MIEALELRQLLTTWYVNNVSGNGLPVGQSDNSGTITAPFLTINAAAQVAQPGDTILIGGSTTPSTSVGVYRETVTPKYSGSSGHPITYEPYNYQYVTVSGADQLPDSGWTLVPGTTSTYQTALNTNSTTDPNPGVTDTANLQTNGEDQVFVNGQMVTEARSGSTVSENPSAPVFSTLTSGVSVAETTPTGYVDFTITDSTLTQTETQNNAWAGGQIYILPGTSGEQWVAETASVLSSSFNTSTGKGTISIQAQEGSNGSSLSSYLPQSGDRYYLFGVEGALNNAGEWFHNSSTLYLWSPDSANLTTTSDIIAVKRRLYAFNLSGISYTDIQGISIFASTILTASGSNYDDFNDITATYLSQYNSDNTLNFGGWNGLPNSGLVLAGTGDQLTNSLLAFSAADLVTVTGTHALISNNILHDADYFAGDQAVVNTDYSPDTDTISGNTIYSSGRSVVLIRDCPNLTITNNDIYWGGLQANDCGGIYQYGGPTDVPDGETVAGGTTEISDNVVHDMGSSTSDSAHKNPACTVDAAIYFDNFSQEYLIDHNVTYNTATGMILNRPGIDIRIVNNTFDAASYSVGAYTKYTDYNGTDYDSFTQTMLENNIFVKSITDITNSSGGNSELNSTTYYPGIASVTSANLESSSPGVVNQADHVYALTSTSPALGLGVPYHDSVLNKEVTAVSTGTTDDGAYETAAALWYVGVAPASLTATEISSTQINLSWTYLDPSQTSFRLQRATNSTFTTGLTTFTPSGTSYSDTGLSPDTTYYYRVQWNDGSGSSSLAGNTTFSATQSAFTLPTPPTVATAAAAGPVTNGTSALTVQGASMLGASTLTYQWSIVGTAPGTVAFNPNGTNAANDTTATFSAPGAYNLLVTITDPYGQTVTSPVTVNVPSSVPPAWLGAGSVATWNSFTQTLTVTGAASVTADPGAAEPIIDASGSAAVLTIDPATGSQVHLGGIDLTGGASIDVASLGAARSATNYTVLVLGIASATAAPTFTMDTTSTLDLADNDMVILYGSGTSPFSAVKADLGRAYDGGMWDTPGLTSSIAKLHSTTYGLGYAEASTLGDTTFDNVTLGSNAVLVKYTLLGDTQLRGSVGIGDYNTVLGNYNSGQTWTSGDFHYGGVVGISDYDNVLNNFGASAESDMMVAPRSARPLNTRLAVAPQGHHLGRSKPQKSRPTA